MNQEKINKIIYTTVKIGIFLTLFVPLIMSSKFFFPFIVPKNVLFRMVVEIIFALYLILALSDKRFRPRFDKLTLAILIFFGILILTTLAGIGIERSIWGNYERMGGIFGELHLLLYFLVLINIFKTKKDWYQFLTFSIFISVVMCFIALAQQLQAPFLLQSAGGQRLTGPIGNATFFAAYLLFNLFFILYFVFQNRRAFDLKLFLFSFLGLDALLISYEIYLKLSKDAIGVITQIFDYPKFLWPVLFFQALIVAIWFLKEKKYAIKFLLSLLFLFEFFIFFNTQTRGALIGFGLGMLLLLGLFSIFDQRKKIRIISAFCLVILILGGIFIYFGENIPLVKKVPTLRRLATISLADITTQSRLLTWQASWQGWTENPKFFLLGVGPENYYYVFNKHFPVEIFRDKGSQIWFDRAHNIIFDIGVTTGFLGLISYLGIFFLALYFLFLLYYRDRTSSSPLLLGILLIAYFLQNIFVFDTLNTSILFYLILAFIVFLTTKEKLVPEETPEIKQISFVTPVIIVIVLAIFLYIFNIDLLKANHYIYVAFQEKMKASSGYSLEAVNYFKLAIDQAVTGRFEARQQLADYTREMIKNKKVGQDEVSRLVDLVASELRKSIKEEPKEVRHHLYLGAFYNSTVQFSFKHLDEGVEVLNQAISLSPSRPHIYFEIGQAKFYQDKKEEAIKFFEKGVELNPKVIDSQLDLTVAYIASGYPEKAEKQLDFLKEELKYNLSSNDYLRFINAYQRVKNYDKAIQLYQKLLELAPQNTDYYAQLAALYAKIGENQKAEEIAKKALELDPSLAQEVELFLEKLHKGELREK